jgi:hypothetical protein
VTDDITRRRWEKAENAAKALPIDLLRVIVDDITKEKENVSSVCIVMLDRCEKGDRVSAVMAGPATTLEFMGMLERAKRLIDDQN